MMKREQNSFRVQTDWLVRGTGCRGHRNIAPSPGHPLNRLQEKLGAPPKPLPHVGAASLPPTSDAPRGDTAGCRSPSNPCAAQGQNQLCPAWGEVSPATARDSIWVSSKETKPKDFLSLLFQDVICINCMKRDAGGNRDGNIWHQNNYVHFNAN